METAKHIDLTYLKQLASGSNQFIVEMIDAFLEQTPEELHNLEKYLNLQDWKLLRSTAHKIKPSFSFMGIKELEPVIKQVEEYAATQQNLELLPGMISQIKNVCTASLEELLIEKTIFKVC